MPLGGLLPGWPDNDTFPVPDHGTTANNEIRTKAMEPGADAPYASDAAETGARGDSNHDASPDSTPGKTLRQIQ